MAGAHLKFVAGGCVASDPETSLAERLLAIHAGLADVTSEIQPHEVAVEETVVNRNPATSLKLGHARGVVILSAGLAKLPVFEYSAKRVKQAVTGTGNATKEQVSAMVQRLLPSSNLSNADANDALAVAICHAGSRQYQSKLQYALKDQIRP